jgi:HSP20 family protein
MGESGEFYNYPGREQGINVTCEGSRLTLSGEKKQEHQEKGANFFRYECRFGKFHRVVTLPAEVQAKGATASFKKGVLEIVLPKSEEAKSKEIKVT